MPLSESKYLTLRLGHLGGGDALNNLDPIRSWLADNGGYLHPTLYLDSGETGVQGVYTSSPISAKEELIRVPTALELGAPLSGTVAQGSGSLQQPEMVGGMLSLLREYRLGSQSEYHPYLELLPGLDQFKHSHPMSCSVKEQSEMAQMLPRLQTSFARFGQATEEFAAHYGNLFSEEETRWAALICVSRGYRACVLLPGCDLFNHSFTRGNSPTSSHTILARIGLSPGEQVYGSYGHNDSLELWTVYGFLDEGAESAINCFRIQFGVGAGPLAEYLGPRLRARGHRVDGSPELGLKIGFGHSVFFTHSGPSAEAIEVCRDLEISETPPGSANRAEATGMHKLYQLLNNYRGEINRDAMDGQPGGPVAARLRDILRQRLEIIECNLQWLRRRGWDVSREAM